MTNEQIQWAMKHDWFVESECAEGEWSVTAVDYISSDEQPELYLAHPVFTDFEELRNWAGY
jgi:hypothetical protein